MKKIFIALFLWVILGFLLPHREVSARCWTTGMCCIAGACHGPDPAKDAWCKAVYPGCVGYERCPALGNDCCSGEQWQQACCDDTNWWYSSNCSPSCGPGTRNQTNACGDVRSVTCNNGPCCPSTVTISGTVTNAPANPPNGVRVCTNTGLCSSYGTGTFSYSIANVPTTGGAASYTLTATNVSGYSASPVNVNPIGCTSPVTGKNFAYNCVPNYSCTGKCGFIDNGCGSQVSCGSCGVVTTGTGPGVVAYKNTLNSGTGNISSKNWKVKVDSAGIRTKYGVAAYWIPTLSGRASILSSATIGGSNSIDSLITANAVTYYRVPSGDLTISDAQNITKDKSVVFIVENGNLNINAPIRRGNKKTYLGFFVKGNITVANNLVASVATDAVIDGMFVADGTFSTGTGTSQFIGNGIFVAFAGVTLARDLGSTGNATSPASSFVYDPSLVISAPSDLARSSYTWSEVAP